MTLAQKVSVNALKKNILKYNEDQNIKASHKRLEKQILSSQGADGKSFDLSQNDLSCYLDPYADKNAGIPEDDDEEDFAAKKAQKELFAKRLLEYPQLQLMVLKKGVRKVDKKDSVNANDEEELIYIDGMDEMEPKVTVRMDNMTKGEYFILYRADFKKDHKNRRINLVFYSEFMQKES